MHYQYTALGYLERVSNGDDTDLHYYQTLAQDAGGKVTCGARVPISKSV